MNTNIPHPRIYEALPAQFTWSLGEGNDLKACHNRDAELAKLLESISPDVTKKAHPKRLRQATKLDIPDLYTRRRECEVIADFGSRNRPNFFGHQIGLLPAGGLAHKPASSSRPW